MFERRSLSPELQRVRAAYAPDCLVVDVAADFETLPTATAEELGLFVDRLEPAAYPDDWLPANAPEQLRRYASGDLTIGLPGDGTVTWTRQTEPPVVFVKRRAEGTPDDFLALLIASAFVEIGADVPETFLPFFGAEYAALADAVPLDGAGTYQLAAALFDGWVGCHTHDAFAAWGDETASDGSTAANDEAASDDSTAANDEAASDGSTAADDEAASDGSTAVDVTSDEGTNDTTLAGDSTHPTVPGLHAAWVDAGERLAPRLDELAGEMARGETTLPAATEYACSAVRHGLDLPAPFSALNTTAYRNHGSTFAVRWASKTLDQLE